MMKGYSFSMFSVCRNTQTANCPVKVIGKYVEMTREGSNALKRRDISYLCPGLFVSLFCCRHDSQSMLAGKGEIPPSITCSYCRCLTLMVPLGDLLNICKDGSGTFVGCKPSETFFSHFLSRAKKTFCSANLWNKKIHSVMHFYSMQPGSAFQGLT